MISKVISGGQTGADMGGLLAARSMGFATGGWAAKGWRTEDGARPVLIELGLQEFPKEGYPARTLANIETADATLIFADENPAEPGSKLTVSLCRKLKKPYLRVPLAEISSITQMDRILEFLHQARPKVLNVAGHRESRHPGMERMVREIMRQVLLTERPTQLVNRHSGKSFQVYIGRPGPWGNPFSNDVNTAAAHQVTNRGEALLRYREWILGQPELLRRARRELKGRILACSCLPRVCHGEVLIELLDGREAGMPDTTVSQLELF